jgi:hypothetical protein
VAHRPKSPGTSTPGGLTGSNVGQLKFIAALLDAAGKSCSRSLPLSRVALALMK